MSEKTFGELTTEEFAEVTERLITEDFGDLTEEEFFTALAALEAEPPRETIEITARVAEGQLVFQETGPIPARENTLRIGDREIVVRLAQTL
jgi:uncharacterized protein (DUF433 family)